MAARSKSRKSVPPAPPVPAVLDAPGAPPADNASELNPRESLPVAPPPGNSVETAAPAMQAAPRAKKKSAPKKKKPADTGGRIVTEQERLAALDSLPSLKTAPKEAENAAVTVLGDSPQPPSIAELPAKEPSASSMVDRGLPIPAHYGMDRLVAMVRDCNWIYVYWELKGGLIDRLRFQHSTEAIDNARWVLRAQNLSAGIQQIVDVDVRIGQWYLKVPAGTEFAVDMGFIDGQGVFVRVLQGNTVWTAHPSVSDQVDERWVILRDELEKLLSVSGAGSPEFSAVKGGSGMTPIKRSELPRAIGLFSKLLTGK